MKLNIAAHTIIEKMFAQKNVKLRPKYDYISDGYIEQRHNNAIIAIVPCWRAHLIDHSKYTGEKLRTIRAKNGVGRPPHAK